ncbi:uncharacterized protein LOC108210203 isoform X1 [Daucus carota subsp. sativus]|uniref:uncharacterized protein LOC108210203 isoform X1 n=1 Tax=Daucus carota subsp. sativus TaxID=79200 RepID=UPI0007EF916D|nr:PREDICTED: uncharacterized protein LOC108210203 isoform X1 [Daucus carota subsp. sativus]
MVMGKKNESEKEEESNASPGEERNRTRGEAEIKASQEPKIEEEESSDDEGPFPEPYPVKRIPVKYYCCSSDSLDSSDSDSEESNASPGEDRNRTRGEAEIKASQEPKIEEEESSDDEGPFPEPYPVKRIPVKYYCCSSDSLDSSDSDSEESNDSPGEDRNRTRGEAEIKAGEYPPLDYSQEAKEPSPGRMVPRNVPHSDSSDFSDFESKNVPETQANKSVLANDLMSASSILQVKYGTKRPTEAGDEDFKRAKTTQE